MSEDILERVKANNERYEHGIGDTTVSNNSLRKMLPELIVEIERLRSEIMRPVETFGTPELVAWIEDLHRLVVDFPEAERGRIPFVMGMGELLTCGLKSWTAARDARIKELEAEHDLYCLPGSILEAALIQLREALERIKELETVIEKDLVLLCKKAAENERLEAAFLEAKRHMIYFEDAPYREADLGKLYDEAEQKAREALEKIKTGSGDHIVEANQMILTAEKRDAMEYAIEVLHHTHCPECGK